MRMRAPSTRVIASIELDCLIALPGLPFVSSRLAYPTVFLRAHLAIVCLSQELGVGMMNGRVAERVDQQFIMFCAKQIAQVTSALLSACPFSP